MRGTILYCESASRFQGKPVKIRATIISIATQNTAERKAQLIRSLQLNFEISFSVADQCSSGPWLLTPETFIQSQTQPAGKIDRKAASAIHPSIGKPVTGILSSQYS